MTQDPDTETALDAYSRIVTAVADDLTPHVAALMVTGDDGRVAVPVEQGEGTVDVVQGDLDAVEEGVGLGRTERGLGVDRQPRPQRRPRVRRASDDHRPSIGAPPAPGRAAVRSRRDHPRRAIRRRSLCGVTV